MNLLPHPQKLRRKPGFLELPERCPLWLEGLASATDLSDVRERIQSAATSVGVQFAWGKPSSKSSGIAFLGSKSDQGPAHAQGYRLAIHARGITVHYRSVSGLRSAMATLRQLFREHGRRLPRLEIEDYPDFTRRGVMLDISRGRVPTLATLIELTDHLADFKINEFQLYTEHTFAYRKYRPVWRDWGALTGPEIRQLDAHCRRLGIELVPNQNSFGHLRYWLEYPPLKKLAETSQPWPDQGGAFLRYPTTLAPTHPGTIPFLRGLYDELLPNFTSRHFNVGCDETWDLGRGRSAPQCQAWGKGRVYLDFLKAIHREVSNRGKQMMFWCDIIMHYPELVAELPNDVIALEWGYEPTHPFERETEILAGAGIPFYVCPGTSTWMSLIGRHDTALPNLQNAARAGLAQGALGFLNTDWGDGGHPQPLAVSYLPYLAGASQSWCVREHREQQLLPVLNRDIFHDSTGRMGEAALAFGLAHRQLKYFAPNVTPLGTVIAAPPPERCELFCRDGLKYYARIPAKNIRAALEEVEAQNQLLKRGRPTTTSARVLQSEFDFAARMAAQSCHIMLWQQMLAAGKLGQARQMARKPMAQLQQLDAEFKAYWPGRNKGTTEKCSAFLQWRIEDYRKGTLHFPPDVAAVIKVSTSAD